MSRFLNKISRLISSVRAKPVGHDLEGNRYFEIPSPNGGRTKRTVDYKIKQDLSEYANGEKLPVQWTSWLSHTRSLPPTIQELETDLQRRYLLQQKVAMINARDAEESSRRLLRQRDGLLLPIEGGSAGGGGVEVVVELEDDEIRMEEKLEKLSSGSLPPSPSPPSNKPSPSHQDPTPSSPPNITHSSLPNPTTSTSPTLRELSQLALQQQRSELERKGVNLEVEAERAGYGSGNGSGVEGVKGVKGSELIARRRGGTVTSPSSPSSSSSSSAAAAEVATPTTTTPESLRSIGQAQMEFDRASKEMNKSVLDGVGPLFDARGVLKGKKNDGEEVKAEAGRKEGREFDTWAAARDRREKGE